MNVKKIWIGNDHGGVGLKHKILEQLRAKGIDVTNVGSDLTEIVRYPYFAAHVASQVSKGQNQYGILICSTGIGMSIIANKFKGVRASLCTTVHMAHMTRLHNNSNILCLGGKIVPDEENLRIVEQWLLTDYEGGRHDISLGLIAEAEEAICNPEGWTPTGPMK